MLMTWITKLVLTNTIQLRIGLRSAEVDLAEALEVIVVDLAEAFVVVAVVVVDLVEALVVVVDLVVAILEVVVSCGGVAGDICCDCCCLGCGGFIDCALVLLRKRSKARVVSTSFCLMSNVCRQLI